MKKMYSIAGTIEVPVECCTEASNRKNAVKQATKGFKDILKEAEILGRNEDLALKVYHIEEVKTI